MSLLVSKESFDWFEDNGFGSDISSGPDSWNGFYLGILAGMAGGALAFISPWLGGALIMIGYGCTAYNLGGSAGRFSRALAYGFRFAAAVGATLVAGAFLFPESTELFVEAVGRKHIIFLGVTSLPWIVAFTKYALNLTQPKQPRPGR